MQRSRRLAIASLIASVFCGGLTVIAVSIAEADRPDRGSEWSPAAFKAKYESQPLRTVMASDFVDVWSLQDVRVRTSHVYVSLPAPDWQERIGRVEIDLKVKPGLVVGDYVLLQLRNDDSAHHVKIAIAAIIRGNDRAGQEMIVDAIRVPELPLPRPVLKELR